MAKRGQVLVVEEDDERRQALGALLSRKHTVHLVANAEQALALVKNRRVHVAVVGELVSPGGMMGRELCAHLRLRYPRMLCAFLGGIGDPGGLFWMKHDGLAAEVMVRDETFDPFDLTARVDRLVELALAAEAQEKAEREKEEQKPVRFGVGPLPSMEETKHELVGEAWRRAGGNLTEAAKSIKVSRTGFYYMKDKRGLESSDSLSSGA